MGLDNTILKNTGTQYVNGNSTGSHERYYNTTYRKQIWTFLSDLGINLDNLNCPLTDSIINLLHEDTGISEETIIYQTDKDYHDSIIRKSRLRTRMPYEEEPDDRTDQENLAREFKKTLEQYLEDEDVDVLDKENLKKYIQVSAEAAREGMNFEKMMAHLFELIGYEGIGIGARKEGRWFEYNTENNHVQTGFEADFVIHSEYFSAAAENLEDSLEKDYWSEVFETVNNKLGQTKLFIDTKLRSNSIGVEATIAKYLNKGSPTNHVVILYLGGPDPKKNIVPVSVDESGGLHIVNSGDTDKYVIYMRIDRLYNLLEYEGMGDAIKLLKNFQEKIDMNTDYEPSKKSNGVKLKKETAGRRKELVNKFQTEWNEQVTRDFQKYFTILIKYADDRPDEYAKNYKKLINFMSKKFDELYCDLEFYFDKNVSWEEFFENLKIGLQDALSHYEQSIQNIKEKENVKLIELLDIHERHAMEQQEKGISLTEIVRDNVALDPLIINRLKKLDRNEIIEWIKKCVKLNILEYDEETIELIYKEVYKNIKEVNLSSDLCYLSNILKEGSIKEESLKIDRLKIIYENLSAPINDNILNKFKELNKISIKNPVKKRHFPYTFVGKDLPGGDRGYEKLKYLSTLSIHELNEIKKFDEFWVTYMNTGTEDIKKLLDKSIYEKIDNEIYKFFNYTLLCKFQLNTKYLDNAIEIKKEMKEEHERNIGLRKVKNDFRKMHIIRSHAILSQNSIAQDNLNFVNEKMHYLLNFNNGKLSSDELKVMHAILNTDLMVTYDQKQFDSIVKDTKIMWKNERENANKRN